MKGVYLLFENISEGEPYEVIGVISDPNIFEKIFDYYYGKGFWRTIDYRDVRDSGIEWVRKLEVSEDGEKAYTITITCHYYLVDDIF